MEGGSIRSSYSPFVIHASKSPLAHSPAGRGLAGVQSSLSLDTHAGRRTVVAKPRLALAFAGLICIALASTPQDASAVTAELAKRCSALTAKVFPPRVLGNPGAGSAKGSGLDEQAYFRRCLASGGKIGDDTPE